LVTISFPRKKNLSRFQRVVIMASIASIDIAIRWWKIFGIVILVILLAGLVIMPGLEEQGNGG
jgi:hypothetical protein